MKKMYLIGLPKVLKKNFLNHYKKYHCSLCEMKKRPRNFAVRIMLQKILLVFKFLNVNKFPAFMKIALYFGAEK